MTTGRTWPGWAAISNATGAQGGPQKDKEQSDGRFSLMNWGHDPVT